MNSMFRMQTAGRIAVLGSLVAIALSACSKKQQSEPESATSNEQSTYSATADEQRRIDEQQRASEQRRMDEQRREDEQRAQGQGNNEPAMPGSEMETVPQSPGTTAEGQGSLRGQGSLYATQQGKAPPTPHELTVARCDRELSCGNVGTGKKYETREQCVVRLDERGYDNLGTDECPSGLRRPKVDVCLQAIRTEACSSPMETLQRLTSCRASVLCMD